MATLSKPVGYECEFVDQVPEDYFCKLCKHVARESTILSCCGECFCKACIDVIIQDKKPCPSCGDSKITSCPQVKYQSKILALEVRCTMKDRGCEWTKQLQHLDAHLDVTTGDCEYVDVECPIKCVQKVQKRNVDTHLANECPNRDYRCPHCNLENKYHVVFDHFDVCSYYPLACSNRCGATFKRDDLPDHMKMCRLEEVQCVFSDAGCQAKFIRENEDEHMDQNIQKHLALMPAATLRISQDFEKKLQEQQDMFEKKLEQKDEEHKQEMQQLVGQLQEQQTRMERLNEKDIEIETFKANIRELQHQVSYLNLNIGLPLYYISFNKSATKSSIVSQPMYTHPGGYRFELKLWPNGADLSKGSHVSVRIYLLKSDHDDSLKFPATFTITVQLLNQHRDQDHHTRDIKCEIKTSEKIDSVYNIGAVDSFIPHDALEWNRDKHTQYLKDDCFKFRITKIIVH